MRLAVAIGVIAVTLAAALYVHDRRVSYTATRPTPPSAFCSQSAACTGGNIFAPPERYIAGTRHPTWEDPVAVLLALGGLAVAVGIAAPRRQSAVS